MEIGVASLARVIGPFLGEQGACEDRCFSDRVTELASTRPLYIRDRDWVGGVVVVETMGVENPHSLSPRSQVTLFPRSRVSSTADINISTLSNQSFLFFSSSSSSSSSPLPSLPAPHGTTSLNRGV